MPNSQGLLIIYDFRQELHGCTNLFSILIDGLSQNEVIKRGVEMSSDFNQQIDGDISHTGFHAIEIVDGHIQHFAELYLGKAMLLPKCKCYSNS